MALNILRLLELRKNVLGQHLSEFDTHLVYGGRKIMSKHC
jgi:hypothetical protein